MDFWRPGGRPTPTTLLQLSTFKLNFPLATSILPKRLPNLCQPIYSQISLLHYRKETSYYSRASQSLTYPNCSRPRARRSHGLPSMIFSPSLTAANYPTEPSRLQIRWRWSRVHLSDQCRPSRAPAQAGARVHRPRQGPLLFQEPRRLLRVPSLPDRPPKRRLLPRTHPRSQTPDQPGSSCREGGKGRQGWR